MNSVSPPQLFAFHILHENINISQRRQNSNASEWGDYPLVKIAAPMYSGFLQCPLEKMFVNEAAFWRPAGSSFHQMKH
jgi:hypothetical protein